LTHFHINTETEGMLQSLGLEYQYKTLLNENGYRCHRNRFCKEDGTVVLEIRIQENKYGGILVIRDINDEIELPVLFEELRLRAVPVGILSEPQTPRIFIRILYNDEVLLHKAFAEK